MFLKMVPEVLARSARLPPALADAITLTAMSSPRYPQRTKRSRFRFPPDSTTRRRIGFAGTSRQRYWWMPSIVLLPLPCRERAGVRVEVHGVYSRNFAARL